MNIRQSNPRRQVADLLAGGEGGELLAAILLVVDLAGHVLQVLHTSQWSVMVTERNVISAIMAVMSGAVLHLQVVCQHEAAQCEEVAVVLVLDVDGAPGVAPAPHLLACTAVL